MRRRTIIYLYTIMLYLLALWPQASGALPVVVSKFPLDGQLPSATVNCVYQDQKGIIWIGTKSGLCRYDGYRMEIFRSGLNDANLLLSNDVTCIAEDSRYYYIGTRKGLNLIDKHTYDIKSLPFNDLRNEIRAIVPDRRGTVWIGTFKRIVKLSADLSRCERFKTPDTSVNSIYTDRRGQLWVMFWKEGLWRYDSARNRFLRMQKVGLTDNPFRMFQDHDGRYCVATWGEGLFTMDGKGHCTKLPCSPELEPKLAFVYSIVQDARQRHYWMVGQKGFLLADIRDGRMEPIDTKEISSKMSRFFNAMYQDRDGNFWIATPNAGIFQMYQNKYPFLNFPIPQIPELYGLDTDIRALYADSDGDLWISQQGMGLGILHTDGKLVTWRSIPAMASLTDMADIAFLCKPSFLPAGHIWTGTLYGQQIWEIEKAGAGFRPVRMYDFATVNHGNLLWSYEDSSHNVWVSTSNGIAVKPAGSDTFQRTPLLQPDVYTMAEIAPGELWTGSRTQGVYKVSYKTSAGKVIIVHSQQMTSGNCLLPTDHVEAIVADRSRNRVWIGLTEGQLLCYDMKKETAEDLSRYLEGSIQHEIVNLAVDRDGYLWIITTASIIKYDPASHNVNIYSTGDQLAVTAYAKNVFCSSTATGRFYFGGTGGVVSVVPAQARFSKANSVIPIISDVKIGGVSIFKAKLGSHYNVDQAERYVSLGSDALNIELDFTTCNYRNPAKTVYAYKLEGVDRDWTYTGENRVFAYYNDLPKGSHKLYIRATDANGQWSDRTVEYTIYRQPRLYETWWAYTLYVAAAILLGLYAYVRAKRRIKEREELRIAKIEKQKDEELTQAKLRYFTNVSHDFLTPITVISCIIDDMKLSVGRDLPQLDSIKVNLGKLKQLIQQVLDFRKIDNGKMHLAVTQTDLVAFLRNLCRDCVEPMVRKKHIAFEYKPQVPMLSAWFDHDKVSKIMMNLLSNAYKYTKNGDIQVNVSTDTGTDGRQVAVIRVSDTGKGMTHDELQHIFERFYTTRQQYDSNGIGLSLVKELADLHHATVSVESEEGHGSTFTITLPIERGSYDDSEIGSESQTKETIRRIEAPADDLPTATADNKELLIVEDNEELLNLMEHIFSRYHRVRKAANGADALKMMEDHEPDLIISDVMMPVMDGLDLCRKLKGDMSTSHIPIILLTARNTPEDRAECYDAGADGYVAKPFELAVLKARIDNFLRQRRQQQAEFRSDNRAESEKLAPSPLDKKLLDKAIGLIEAHINDENFDVINLSEAMCMSKSTLYRKLKAITGLSPVEFIRNIRLKRAYQMLRQEESSITDIAFHCGFSSLRYFSKCFKEEFGITPTDLRKNG